MQYIQIKKLDKFTNSVRFIDFVKEMLYNKLVK